MHHFQGGKAQELQVQFLSAKIRDESKDRVPKSRTAGMEMKDCPCRANKAIGTVTTTGSWEVGFESGFDFSEA